MPITSDLTDLKGAVYFPARAYNSYQTWWNYRDEVIEADLNKAAALGLDTLRVYLSYEWWREQVEDDTEANAHISSLYHLLNQADQRGLTILPVFFESIGDEPTPESLRDQNINTAFAVHSPSRQEIIRPREWSGYVGSPEHFVRRVVSEFDDHDAVLAWEIMNEPGDVQPRRDFVGDMLLAAEANGDKPLTMGCKDFSFNLQYDNPTLDIYQWHRNLPPATDVIANDIQQAQELRDVHDKPVWCTEWQRLRTEPPSRFLPYYNNMARFMNGALDADLIDGHFFWGLMFKPAYIRSPRQDGRLNGLFHEDGTVFNKADADAIAGRETGFEERTEIPNWIAGGDFPWPDVGSIRRAEWRAAARKWGVPAVGAASVALAPLLVTRIEDRD